MGYIHRHKEHNTYAAKEIVPFLIELFKPNSIIDIGCGLGTWLKIFSDMGIEEYIGIDGSYINKTLLEIPLEKYLSLDLEESIIINKKYDLLICLEVAEHLTCLRAEGLIKDLVSISDTIVFSAAIPYQSGQNHINEQYPDYWIRLFNKYNFEAFDLIRPKFWNNNNIDWWYRQNILVFKKNSKNHSFLQTNINPIITKELYERKLEEIESIQIEKSMIELGSQKFRYYLKAIFKRVLIKLK